MKKFLLTFEFRYLSIPKNDLYSAHTGKIITIGVFDTIDDAIQTGNISLDELSKTFDIREKFEKIGLFGSPRTLVSNTFTRDKVEFFGKITTLDFQDLTEVIIEALESRKQYDKFKQSEKQH